MTAPRTCYVQADDSDGVTHYLECQYSIKGIVIFWSPAMRDASRLTESDAIKYVTDWNSRNHFRDSSEQMFAQVKHWN